MSTRRPSGKLLPQLLRAIAILACGIFVIISFSQASATAAVQFPRGSAAATSTPASPSGACDVSAATPCEPAATEPAQQTSYNQLSQSGVVNVVLFWMQGCPHCEAIMKTVIPALQAKYGNSLAVQEIELTDTQEVDRLYQLGARLGIPKEKIGVPLLLLDDQYLIGDQDIQDKLPGLIEKGLAAGGVSFPDIPEFLEEEKIRAGSTDVPNKAIIYLFWGDGCPHCAEAKPFLQQLDSSSEQVELRMYEVWYVEENRTLFTQMARAFGFEPQAVPTIFIGDQYWVGYNNQIRGEIQAAVEACLANGCPDAGAGIIPAVDTSQNGSAAAPIEQPASSKDADLIDLPIIGTVDLSSQTLLISTALIAFVDGVNPCSVWVLTMLLALTLHTGSRKKVLLIGLIFLTVTAGVYALFIAGLFTVFKIVSFVGWIQVLVALVALFFGLVNIKDYFWYQEGISFTIADEKKPGIFRRIRSIMDASQSIWGLAAGTILLAGGVSLVEFSCTAGFPVIWTNLLVSQKVTTITFILLLLVYLLIYQIDEMGIFLAAVFSMRASKLEEKHGRILKLIGGMLMLTLAGVMLINPGLMNKLSSSLIVFAVAFMATMLILFLHRRVLPALGIRIGTEFTSKARRKKRSSSRGADHVP